MCNNILKRYCIIKMSVCVLLLITLSVTLHYLYKSNAYILQHNLHIADEIRKLNFEVMDVHKHEAVLNDSGILWQEISTSNIYSTSTFYKENVGTLITNLCKKYYLFNSQINISSPKIVNHLYNKQYIDVIKSRVDINFSSISDEYVFLFLNAVRHDVSGYVKVVNFNIEKKTDITNEVLHSALKGEAVATISGHVSFDLYSIVGRFIDES
ncbi:hypothetical protein DRF75_03330 [Ehrlichia minasensis]|uniref:Uncharacterized protein n=1 Tax=Ehrlichia minasensis TaxID=1242993 RepID=A0A4Q6IBA2_9RICK|nr:hypothetical protein [Ehrlichia minasensis]RZB12578.1 hypothetical protein DRF75_03330 [Ehrlichia minasensis]CEI84831.1 Uncharacterized protein ehr_00199 [Ehrlichia minasensis]